VPALLTGLAAALLVAGCGVPPSGVIEAGDPATGITPALDIYFLSGGSLVPVPRQIPPGADVGTAVRLLFDGPFPPENGKLRTELPRLKIAPAVYVESDGTVLIRLSEDVPPFTETAMEQLVCTADAAPSPSAGGPPAVPTFPPGSVPGSGRPGGASSVPTGAKPDPATGARQDLAGGDLRPRVLVVSKGWRLSRQDVPCPAE
jgi:hypothetical protein